MQTVHGNGGGGGVALVVVALMMIVTAGRDGRGGFAGSVGERNPGRGQGKIGNSYSISGGRGSLQVELGQLVAYVL